jgi:hypothetical protein
MPIQVGGSVLGAAWQPSSADDRRLLEKGSFASSGDGHRLDAGAPTFVRWLTMDKTSLSRTSGGSLAGWRWQALAGARHTQGGW